MILKKFRVGEKEITLVGVAHVIPEDAARVEELIEELKPEAVAVELDERRLEALRLELREVNLREVLRAHGFTFLLFYLLLLSVQQRLGKALRARPGEEMLRAVEAAECVGAKVYLIDRDLGITLRRALARMNFVEKLKLFASILASFFTKPEMELRVEEDFVSKLLKELAKEFPATKEVLVDERDAYMAKRLAEVREKRIIAVVGAGHLDGLEKELKEGSVGFAEELEAPLEPAKYSKLGLVVLAVFLTLIALGTTSRGSGFLLKALEAWVLYNGLFAALGAALALAHPISVVVAFLAAPLTSLNPFLAAGWFAAASELSLRKPGVEDFSSLAELKGVRDIYKNKVTRIILVAVLTNLGSTLGTFVALTKIVSQL